MERWPPSYDAHDLIESIRQLRDHHQTHAFFQMYQAVAHFCQGDVVRLESEIPLLDANGTPSKIAHENSLWLIIGNTCDLEREADDLKWTQMVPILDLGNEDQIRPGLLNDLKNYRTSRFFYLPDWTGKTPPTHFMADLTMPVTVDKQAIRALDPVARLTQTAWILLNACLVRFLARDDGRFAA